MIVNPHLIWRAYKQASETDEVACMLPEDARPYLDWISKHIDCEELIGFLEEWPFADDEQLCASYILSLEHMKEYTQSNVLLERDFLVVGSAPNGDYIVIPRKRPTEVGFVDHEILDDRNDICNYIRIADSMGELYFNSWNKDDFPCDYYDALRKQEHS